MFTSSRCLCTFSLSESSFVFLLVYNSCTFLFIHIHPPLKVVPNKCTVPPFLFGDLTDLCRASDPSLHGLRFQLFKHPWVDASVLLWCCYLCIQKKLMVLKMITTQMLRQTIPQSQYFTYVPGWIIMRHVVCWWDISICLLFTTLIFIADGW